MATQVAEGFRFSEYEPDRVSFELRRTGLPWPVESQVFDVLAYLLRHHAVVVSKEELLDNVWGDRFVSESASSSRIKSARKAVGDDGRRQEVIRTVHGRGFRIVAPVENFGDRPPEAMRTPDHDPRGTGPVDPPIYAPPHRGRAC